MARGNSEPIAEENPASRTLASGQSDVRRQLRVRGLDPSDDLGGSISEQLAGFGEADASADALQ